jgi:hypothetical protein
VSNQDLKADAHQTVAEALNRLGQNPTAGQVVAELSFGFWVGLIGQRRYIQGLTRFAVLEIALHTMNQFLIEV